MSNTSSQSHTERSFKIWQFIVLVVVYLVLIQGLGALLTQGFDGGYAAPQSLEELLLGMTIPIGVSAVLVYGVVAVLRWWRPVFIDDVPVRRWVMVVPIIMIVAIATGINYGGLLERGLAFSAVLLLTTMFVGFAEEGMFRGIGLTTFRRAGLKEWQVALWSTVIFGVAHATNIFSEGISALAQVVATIIAGYFFYLIRRRTRGLVIPAILHGLWDFALITSVMIPGKTHLGAGVMIVADVVLLIIVLVGWRKIEPRP